MIAPYLGEAVSVKTNNVLTIWQNNFTQIYLIYLETSTLKIFVKELHNSTF